MKVRHLIVALIGVCACGDFTDTGPAGAAGFGSGGCYNSGCENFGCPIQRRVDAHGFDMHEGANVRCYGRLNPDPQFAPVAAKVVDGRFSFISGGCRAQLCNRVEVGDDMAEAIFCSLGDLDYDVVLTPEQCWCGNPDDGTPGRACDAGVEAGQDADAPLEDGGLDVGSVLDASVE
jgi:hypothetical protein